MRNIILIAWLMVSAFGQALANSDPPVNSPSDTEVACFDTNRIVELEKENKELQDANGELAEKVKAIVEKNQRLEHKYHVLGVSVAGAVIAVILVFLLASASSRKMPIVSEGKADLCCPRCGRVYSKDEKVCKNCKTRF